jgi:superfamily II DNA or RNA helicase
MTSLTSEKSAALGASFRRVLADYEPTLRPNQIEFGECLCNALEAGDMQAFLGVMATGAGKTKMYALIAQAAVNIDMNVAVVSPKIDLGTQNAENILKSASTIEEKDIAVLNSRVSSREKEKRHTAGIHSVTYDGVKGGNITLTDYDVVIFDEAQYLNQGDRLRKLMSDLLQTENETLFFAATATPKQSAEKDLTKLFGEPVYEMSLREAIQSGILAGAEAYLIDVKVDLGLGTPDKAGNYTEADLRLTNTDAINRVLIELYLEELQEKTAQGKYPPTVKIFATSVEHCETLAEKFNDYFQENGMKGLHADYLAGARGKENAQIIKAAQAGRVQVLISDQIAIEGIDLPQISSVFVVGTKNETQTIQSFGRGLRQHDELMMDEFLQALAVEDPKMALALLLKAAEPKTMKGYNIVSEDMRLNYLFSDALEGSSLYPDAQTSSSPSRASLTHDEKNRNILEDLPSYEIITNIQRIAELRTQRNPAQKKQAAAASKELSSAEVAAALGHTRDEFKERVRLLKTDDPFLSFRTSAYSERWRPEAIEAGQNKEWPEIRADRLTTRELAAAIGISSDGFSKRLSESDQRAAFEAYRHGRGPQTRWDQEAVKMASALLFPERRPEAMTNEEFAAALGLTALQLRKKMNGLPESHPLRNGDLQDGKNSAKRWQPEAVEMARKTWKDLDPDSLTTAQLAEALGCPMPKLENRIKHLPADSPLLFMRQESGKTTLWDVEALPLCQELFPDLDKNKMRERDLIAALNMKIPEFRTWMQELENSQDPVLELRYTNVPTGIGPHWKREAVEALGALRAASGQERETPGEHTRDILARRANIEEQSHG